MNTPDQFDCQTINPVQPLRQQCGEEPAKEKPLAAMLLQSRLVMVVGEVDQELAEDVIGRLLLLDAKSHDPIKVIIASPGGHVDSGYAIHDVMRFIASPVISIGAGWVASIAVPILLAVYDGSDTLIARFEYGTGRLPVCMTQGSDTYYFAYDQVGSLRGIFNSSGSLVHEIRYDAWGNILFETDSSGLCVPFGFAGGMQDRDTSLVLFGFRDYDSGTSRWTTLDPIGFSSGDVHLYGYCAGDPVNITDFLGLWSWDGGWIQYGVGGLFGFYGGTVAASGWMEMDRGLAAGIDGLNPVPFWNPLQFMYENEDGSVDTIYHMSRLSGNISFMALATAATLGLGGCMAHANGLGQVSSLGRFTLGRATISAAFTLGLDELFGYGSTGLLRTLFGSAPFVLAGLSALDFIVEIHDIYSGLCPPENAESSNDIYPGLFPPRNAEPPTTKIIL